MAGAKIYTKTGDTGETGLVGGQRLSKSDELIDLYGTCDELNSFIGLLVAEIDEAKDKLSGVLGHKDYLLGLQSRLFDLGSLLACEKDEREKFSLPVINDQLVVDLEKVIDEVEEKLPSMKNFILPSGSRLTSTAHVCRTICRRFERLMVRRERVKGDIPENALKFINRLSDYFFSLARLINKDLGSEEIIWKKG